MAGNKALSTARGKKFANNTSKYNGLVSPLAVEFGQLVVAPR